MKITGHENAQAILKELGVRIKQYRISLNITQIDLANKCGVSSSTLVRIENGDDSLFSNYLRILNGLGLLQNIDILIPEAQPNFKDIYENKPIRQRAKSENSKSKSNWVWEEDK